MHIKLVASHVKLVASNVKIRSFKFYLLDEKNKAFMLASTQYGYFLLNRIKNYYSFQIPEKVLSVFCILLGT